MRVVIVGGGYAGAAAALRLGVSLRRERSSSVTLLNPRDQFVERIRLHQVAAGQTLPRRRLEPLLARAGAAFMRGTVAAVDRAAGAVLLDDGRRVPFDRLVMAAGSTVAPPDIPTPPRHALVLDPTRATEVQARLAALGQRGRLAIVGGGLTAIETAAELRERFPRLGITLVSRAEPLPSWSRDARDYVRDYFRHRGIELAAGARVTALHENELETTAGRLRADACLWAAGFAPAPIAARAQLATDARGKLPVDPLLRSVADPRIYVVGDLAAPVAQPGHPLPEGCKSAMPTGVHAADNIAAEALGYAPHHFDFATPFYCVSLGRRDGLIQFPGEDGEPTGRVVTGVAGAWLKEIVCKGTWWSLSLESRGVKGVWWKKTGTAPAALDPSVRDTRLIANASSRTSRC